MFIEPAFGKKFFGREEVLGTLQKRVTALKGGYRQNLALAGPMLAGKSSILRHFLKDIRGNDVVPLYIEMDDGDFRMFCMRFMTTLLYHYLRMKGDRADGDFVALADLCRGSIPKTVKAMDGVVRSLDRKKQDAAYEKLLAITSVFKEETGRNCIVILDEFHNLSNFRLKRPYQVFGKFIMVQKNTMYVVSSSQKTLLGEILSRKLSLLFGNFEVIEVRGFDNHTARSFVSDKLPAVPSCEKIKDYLIQLTQGSPFYLEVLSSRFAEHVAKTKSGRCDIKECLLNSFSDLLYESDGVLNQYFTNNLNFFLEKRSRKRFIPVLVSLAKGNSTMRAIQEDLGKADKDLGHKLKQLQDMDLVYNSGVFYKISDKLFEYWLSRVYRLKAQAMIDELDIKYLEFKDSVDADYAKYCAFASRGIDDIVCSLFGDFGGEKIGMGCTVRKMPRFDSVLKGRLKDQILQVRGTSQNREWVCHIKQGDIAGEQDIYDLCDVAPGNSVSRVARRIFIPLNGIDQNAFLLAKEQNVWVWEARQLNEVLRLFTDFELVL